MAWLFKRKGRRVFAKEHKVTTSVFLCVRLLYSSRPLRLIWKVLAAPKYTKGRLALFLFLRSLLYLAPMVQVRIANPTDAAALVDIYAPYIRNTAFTFETEIPTVDQFSARIQNCLVKFPWIVCTIHDTMAGYVYASVHRDREAYQWTCECSIYLDPKFSGKGLGKELYALLFAILRQQGLRNIYAGITLPNEPSVRLHESCGFSLFAVYENVGFKQGSWHKVGWWRLRINEYDTEPAPPLKFSLMDRESFSREFNLTAQRIQSKFT
jgi:L-amino acid N-acyltransferase YncA